MSSVTVVVKPAGYYSIRPQCKLSQVSPPPQTGDRVYHIEWHDGSGPDIPSLVNYLRSQDELLCNIIINRVW